MIVEVENELEKWGAWSRNAMKLNRGGTSLGRMMKRKQIENGELFELVIDIDLLNDDDMLQLDRLIGTLPKAFIKLLTLRYIARYDTADIARALRVHRNTVANWLAEIKAWLSRALGCEYQHAVAA